ncbi:glycohydrolase toxin TNT-related protein [uncultured Chryseobacterium sp.]|uniref:glycohydrolase toxin TNT-related protein n=1 Tax=uncultured Chryseobacterium sp. TaxID=259322 RepID=UPI0026244C32|nr:glycohydrolase toxin TNT-related protein [uncultured Chryseobacterium sp.]
MSRHKKTFAPRSTRSDAQNHHKDEEKKYQEITNQDVRTSLSKGEVTQLTYNLFRNKAFYKIEKGFSIIKFSDRGLHVLVLNNLLNKLGYKTSEKEAFFLHDTRSALISFQRRNSITPSGIFNRETLLKMDKQLKTSGNKKKSTLSVSQRAKMLYDAFEHRTWGFLAGTDEDKVFKALDKLTYEDRFELIDYYSKHYKSKRKAGLIQDLYKELDDKDLYKAIRLLYANYEAPEIKSEPEPKPVPKGHELQEVVIYATRPYPWIKTKTNYTIEGESIEFDCAYQYERPIMYPTGKAPKLPMVVRKVLVHVDNKVYNLYSYPSKKIRIFSQDGSVISQFSINPRQTGEYTFVFIIENTSTKEFVAYTKKHRVKSLKEAASDELKENKVQKYSDFRQQVAYVDFNLSKGAYKDQKTNPNFYIKSESKNPAEVGAVYADFIPHLYFSVKGKPIPKDHHYFWFAEINTPKEMADGASALLGVQYSKDANVHGYKRGEYFGKDGWNMNSSHEKAAFLGSFTGVFTIHCMVLDKNNEPTGIQASYRQVVLPKEEYKALQNFREYKKNIDKSFNSILPNTALALNAVAVNEKTTEAIPLNLFLGKGKTNPKNYVLVDLTPGVEHQRTYVGSSIKELFKEFDSKNTYPDGMLAYEIPANGLGYPKLKGSFTTNGASFWEELSSEAGWASLGLAVAGLVASFTPAAPIAPFLFVASGATGAASGTASIIDKVQKGTLTNQTLALDVITIASSFLGMAGSLSSIVKTTSIIKISATGMRYIILTDFALNGTATLMITYDGLESIRAIQDNNNMTTAQKIDAIVKILGQLTLASGLLVLSSKNLKGAELDNFQNPKKENSKKPFNPEQHSEFIDTPENLPRGKTPKVISKTPQTPKVESVYKLPSFEKFVETVDGGFPSEEIAKQAYDLFKSKKWQQLEQLFKEHKLNDNWPPNRGATGTIETTLKKDGVFDRYGGWIDDNGNFQDKGTFAGKDGTPYSDRALPKGTDSKPYTRYEILKDIPGVNEGEIIPWFGEKGGGIQYELPASINDLIKEGYIRPISKSPKNTKLVGQKSIEETEENLINTKNEVDVTAKLKEETIIHDAVKKSETEIKVLKSPETKFGKIRMAYEYYKQLGWDNSRIQSHLDGIDFTKPVELIELPKNKITSQYQAPGGKKGNYFAEPDAKATELGINPYAETSSGIVEKTKALYTTDQSIIVLKSTARSGINDTWSVPSQKPYKTKGEGIQYFTIDNSVFIPIEQ